MTIATETLAGIVLDGKVDVLGANDAARSSFTAQAGNSLVARSGVGVVPAGLDVNHGWYPKDIAASLGLLKSHVKVVAG